ncbi:type II secretion system secretin GspD [Noviherbaspirillum galbum]|uniref:Type IV pilus biogenesis and competence protein PilQ n=1 Tax=Noviherbaspirillum galbum TaxID=2709383 RepID=A0A6B3SKR1_9BURK|nr:type II secretion system secretin GspD [Noviherbaspirillum galbum]NEX61350.1 type II secretion system secretin GspD [Noviherbaspirillum galbum]
MERASSGHGQRTPAWRRIGAAAMVLCMLSGTPVVHAQDPSSNQATLNFVGADIESVIKAVGHFTRTTFIIDPRVKGTINLVSEKPVNKAQAMDMLTSALRLQGFAVVRSDGYTKVVPEADAKLQAGPTIAAGNVRGDQIATQIFHLNYEQAANLVPVLRPLISPNNTINANPGNNSIVITDYADNLKRLSRIITSLDSPAVSDLDVVPVRHAVATDIASMVNRLLDQAAAAPGAAAGADRTTVLADSRTNSVIVRAPSVARANFAKSLVAKLDQPTALPGNVHVVYLKNADAVRLAQTLRAVVASDPAAQGSGGVQQQQQQPQQQQTALNATGQQGALGGGQLQPSNTPAALPTGGAGGFIQADPATNALIITASEAVYRNLRAVIDQLDARRAQVYVESLIVEVNADKAAEFGIQWLGLTGDSTSAYRLGGGTGFSTGGNNLISQGIAKSSTGTPIAPGNGLNIGLFRQINGALTLGALAHALESDANANILSVPNLITLDNEEARIIVGQNVPFITGQYTTQASGGAAGVNPFQTIERRDIGLSLRVRPQVSEGGTIKMAIYQETSSIRDTTNTAGIITNKRSIESNVLVDDGQVIVLGGLIEDQVSDGDEKVPGLGDIPVVGNLFKYQTRKRTKTNLMVFLRPTVIRSSEQSVNLVNDRYDYIRGVQAASQPKPAFAMPDVNAPMLPPLNNGVPQGLPLVNMPRVQSNNPAANQPAQPMPYMQQGVQPGNSPNSPPNNPQPQAPLQPAAPAPAPSTTPLPEPARTQ